MKRAVLPILVLAFSASLVFAERDWTACPSEIPTIGYYLGLAQMDMGAAREFAESGEERKLEGAACYYGKTVQAARQGAKMVAPLEEYEPAYRQILSTILAATNRVQGLSVETGANDYETVRAIFQTLPPRKAEEPNNIETWTYGAHELKRCLAWVPRERDWLTNYVATAGDSFSFVAIRDRMEKHLERASEVWKVAPQFERLAEEAWNAHYTLCTNRFAIAWTAATNDLAAGKFTYACSPFFRIERMIGFFNDDGHLDDVLSKMEEGWEEYERQKINFTADHFDLADPDAQIRPFRREHLKKPPMSPDLTPVERDLEFAGDVIAFSKANAKPNWFTAIQFLRVARNTIDRNLPKDGEEPTEIQTKFLALVSDLDATELELLTNRFRIDYADATQYMKDGKYIRARRPLNTFSILLEPFNRDDRYHGLLEMIDDVLEESHRIEQEKADIRTQKGQAQ